MPVVNLVLTAEINGARVDGSPFTQIMELFGEQARGFTTLKPVDTVGVYAVIPGIDDLTAISVLLLSNPDAELIYRFAGQTNAGLTVPAGGLLLLSGASLEDGVLVNNSSSGAAATIVGMVAGT